MRAWFELGYTWLCEEENLWFGMSSFKHRRKQWKGFTVYIHFFKWLIVFNAVDNILEYNKIMHRRSAAKGIKS